MSTRLGPLSAHPRPLSLRYRRPAVLLPLRVVVSTCLDLRRRVVAPAGESLWCSHNFASQSERTPAARTFDAPNESNQSKGALHSSQLRGYKVRPVNAMLKLRRTPAAISSPNASLRIGAWTGDFCAANDRIALGPLQSRRAAQGFAGARDSAHQQLTSGSRLNAAAAGRVVSSARPAKTEQRRAIGPRPTGDEGRLSFGSFSLAKQRKGTRLSGRKPDAASRSEQDLQGKAQARLRYVNAYPALRYRRVRLNGMRSGGAEAGGRPAALPAAVT